MRFWRDSPLINKIHIPINVTYIPIYSEENYYYIISMSSHYFPVVYSIWVLYIHFLNNKKISSGKSWLSLLHYQGLLYFMHDHNCGFSVKFKATERLSEYNFFSCYLEWVLKQTWYFIRRCLCCQMRNEALEKMIFVAKVQ